MHNEWTEIACEVPAAMVDLVSDFLVELSGNGVSIENLSVDTFSLDNIETLPVKTVKAYFGGDADTTRMLSRIEDFLRVHGPGFAGFIFSRPTVTAIRDEDWANSWKEHFKPVRIGSRLVIKPTWEEFLPGEGDIILQLDPGMAFGTGAHPTTKMCLEELERLLGKGESLLRSVLDVGTGSGVLSIAAVKLGADTVVAIDIDADAVSVAEENLALNGIGNIVQVSATPIERVTGTYDIVLANILAEELVRLAGELARRVAAGGYLILSGILTEKEESVTGGFAGLGLNPVATNREEEWSCLTLHRDS